MDQIRSDGSLQRPRRIPSVANLGQDAPFGAGRTSKASVPRGRTAAHRRALRKHDAVGVHRSRFALASPWYCSGAM